MKRTCSGLYDRLAGFFGICDFMHRSSGVVLREIFFSLVGGV
jgi:hypothetical protein